MRILTGSLKNRLFHQIKASHKMKFSLSLDLRFKERSFLTKD